jgi:hypothetical protein
MGMGLDPILKSPKTDPMMGKRNSSFKMPVRTLLRYLNL